MPVSRTTQGRPPTRQVASGRIAFRWVNGVGTPIESFAAQWLACALPYRRFAAGLSFQAVHLALLGRWAGNARLGADAVGYTFIVEDFHLLLLAGLSRRTDPEYSRALLRSSSVKGIEPFGH